MEKDLAVKSIRYNITKDEAWKRVEEFLASKGYEAGRDLGEEMTGPVDKNGILCWKATGPYYDREVGLIGDYEIYVSTRDGSIVSHRLRRVERGGPYE
ncbi:MAG: hypothetical protein ABIM74_06015 [candidate division WOR-3 bacterium]